MPDASTAGTAPLHRPPDRPSHLRLSYILFVVAGGALGTLARYGVDQAIPSPSGWPLATLTVNLCGAFALGLLLEFLLRQGNNDAGSRVTLRLLFGTGFLGAFTTYSALALEVVQLHIDGRTGIAALYLAISVFGGVLAGWFGIWIGTAQRNHQRETGTAAGNATPGPRRPQ